MAARYPPAVPKLADLSGIAALRISESKDTRNVLIPRGFGSEARSPGRGKNAADT
jgi:hypothetical protein